MSHLDKEDQSIITAQELVQYCALQSKTIIIHKPSCVLLFFCTDPLSPTDLVSEINNKFMSLLIKHPKKAQ
jgi:hypothetical protein